MSAATPSVAQAPEGSAAREERGALLEGRGPGWLIVARKELADHLLSVRLLILLVVLGASAIVPLYFASDTIRNAASNIADTRSVFLFLFTLSPENLPLPSAYRFIGIMAPLMGVAFAFDAINSERSDGTLPRLLSQPIHRDEVVTGKFVAGLAVITLALVSVVLFISGFGIYRLGIIPTLPEVFRLVAWLLLAVLWVSLWLAFGLLLSVVLRRAATAALAGFGVWAFLQIFGSLLVQLVTGIVAPVASAATAQEYEQFASLSNTIWRFLPVTLYQEAAAAILNPSQTLVATPTTIAQIAQFQYQQASAQYLGTQTILSLDQSLLLIWPHVVALFALTAVCFALAYVRFMRQEVRA